MTTSNFAQVKYTLHLYVKIIIEDFLKAVMQAQLSEAVHI